MTDKIDFRRALDGYRAGRGSFRLVELLPLQYLMIDGHGDPNTPAFTDAVQALYPVAYAVKFASKASGRDYVVPPLEGLWWADRMESFTRSRDKTQWHWTLMTMTPEWVDRQMVAAAVARSAQDRVRLEPLAEGLCVQTLHLGSFDDEAEVLDRMHRFIADQGLQLSGRHHEIYLSDFRRVPPEKRRTILRQPVVAG